MGKVCFSECMGFSVSVLSHALVTPNFRCGKLCHARNWLKQVPWRLHVKQLSYMYTVVTFLNLPTQQGHTLYTTCTCACRSHLHVCMYVHVQCMYVPFLGNFLCRTFKHKIFVIKHFSGSGQPMNIKHTKCRTINVEIFVVTMFHGLNFRGH